LCLSIYPNFLSLKVLNAFCWNGVLQSTFKVICHVYVSVHFICGSDQSVFIFSAIAVFKESLHDMKNDIRFPTFVLCSFWYCVYFIECKEKLYGVSGNLCLLTPPHDSLLNMRRKYLFIRFALMNIKLFVFSPLDRLKIEISSMYWTQQHIFCIF
jgi:hypothetical protein